jgi:hypothetical protein
MRDDDPLAPPEDEPSPPPTRPKRPEPRPTEAERADSFEESPAERAEPVRIAATEEPRADAREELSADEPTEPEKTPKKKRGHMLHEGEFTAPSIGPNTVIEKRPPGERLDFDKISDTDAMGKDKRRVVVGGTYGPTRARVFATFATFFAVMAALIVGLYFLAKELDQPPAENVDEAPWSAPAAEQTPPRPLQ